MKASEARHIIAQSSRVAFFTGSGISAESGIATFRDSDGLWQKYDPDEFANASGLLKNALLRPSRLADFLYDFLAPIVKARPNSGHTAIAGIEQQKKVAVITQNVDGLHQRGGSTKVIELHGSIFEIRRLLLARTARVDLEELSNITERLADLENESVNIFRIVRALRPSIKVDLTGIWVPNLVLFGQRLPPGVWESAVAEVQSCNCLVVVGTSLSVFPAAQLVSFALHAGASVIQIDASAEHDDCVTGLATEILPEILRAS